MVGGATLRALLTAPDVETITALGRRPSGLSAPNLNEIQIGDFGDRDTLMPHLDGIDTVFHCLATYSNKVSRDEYRKITVDWLETLLRATEQAAPEAQFALFSAAGARPDGGGFTFSLRTKGAAENRLFESTLPRKFAFRPAAIAPSVRKAHPSLGDRMASVLVSLVPASGITSDNLARAMLTIMQSDARNSAVVENSEIRAAIR